jgi:hypothetical protein
MALPSPEPELKVLSGEDAWAFFDAEARRRMKMSGEEFLARWDAGEFARHDHPQHGDIVFLSMMLAAVITELGAGPPRNDWQAVLSESKARVRDWATWA